jgi:hypothetical protein
VEIFLKSTGSSAAPSGRISTIFTASPLMTIGSANCKKKHLIKNKITLHYITLTARRTASLLEKVMNAERKGQGVGFS